MRDTVSKSVQIQTLAIPKETDITELFAVYANRPWSMLLDSANSSHVNARFDFFVAAPMATIVAFGTDCQISENGQQDIRCQGNPLSIVRSLMKRVLGDSDSLPLQDNNPGIHLPFHCGAAGYFGYDLGRCFENLPDSSEHSYSTPDMAIGLYTWCVVKDNVKGVFYLVELPGFDNPNTNDIESLVNAKLHYSDSNFCMSTSWQANMDKTRYQQSLDKVHEYLRAGDCYQVNFAQRFSAQYQGSEWSAYLSLRKANQAPFSAFIRLDESVILSISPERFISLNDKKVKTQPIKGTRPRFVDNKVKDQEQITLLQSSPKDKAENLMIVDLLRNDLSRSCAPGTIDVPQLFEVESFEAVHHLVSTVTGQLDDNFDAYDLLQGAFPGGSITGAPKVRAMEIIDELEPNRRNIYCGSIGYIDVLGNMDTNICIRTLLCENDTMYCWAGGGIVLDSTSEDEYQESLDKVSKILPILERL
ncbi:MAG: aminodeoxychorismate synthase component I [Aliiglaciecola sp.]